MGWYNITGTHCRFSHVALSSQFGVPMIWGLICITTLKHRYIFGVDIIYSICLLIQVILQMHKVKETGERDGHPILCRDSTVPQPIKISWHAFSSSWGRKGVWGEQAHLHPFPNFSFLCVDALHPTTPFPIYSYAPPYPNFIFCMFQRSKSESSYKQYIHLMSWSSSNMIEAVLALCIDSGNTPCLVQWTRCLSLLWLHGPLHGQGTCKPTCTNISYDLCHSSVQRDACQPTWG